MAEEERQFTPEPDDFEEIESPEEMEETEIIHTIKDEMARILRDIDPDEIDEFDWCEFNREALESVTGRICANIPQFMKAGKITDPCELSLINPPYRKKLRYYSSKTSWFKFLGELVRDSFPEFTFERFGVNRIDMASVMIQRLIVPLLKGERPNIKVLEEEFNEKLLYRLVQKRSAKED